MKSQTPWTPPTKNTSNWSNNIAKSSSGWSNNIAKKLTAFTGIVKNAVSWQGASSAFTPYLYDDATLNYDSATRSYDYTVAQSNQINTKNPTAYTVVV